MSLKKHKKDIIESDIIKYDLGISTIPKHYYGYIYDDYDDYDEDNYNYYHKSYDEYDYAYDNDIIYSPSGTILCRKVNINSFYSESKKREIKIDKILGLVKEESKITLKDFIE